MIRPQDLLCPKPEGLYCAPGDFYIDPTRPVARAVITHGHADHARAGHGAVLATAETLDIMAERYGLEFAGAAQAAAYGEAVPRDAVEVTLVPAVPGSAVVVRWKGLTWWSRNFKRRRDPTCPPFEPVPATSSSPRPPRPAGLPPSRRQGEIARLLRSVAQFPKRSHLVRRLRARQGAADHPPAARAQAGRGRLRLAPWAAERPLRTPRHEPQAAGAGHRRPRERQEAD